MKKYTLLFSCLCLSLLTKNAAAQSLWDGADYANSPNWSDVNNWVGQNEPSPTGSIVTFTGATGTMPVMDSSYSVLGLTFDNNTTASFTLTNANSSILTLDGGVTNNSTLTQVLAMPVTLATAGPSPWDIVNAGVSITVNAAVSDSGNGLAVSGTGTLELAGSNTFTGNITNASGSTLEIVGSGDLGDNGSGSGNYAGAVNANGTFMFNSSAPQTFTGAINVGPTGAFTINNTGSAAQTFTGPISISGLFTDNNTGTSVQTLSGSFTINANGTFTDNSSVSQVIDVTAITNNGTLNYNCSASQSFPIPIVGSGSLTVNGPGALTLTATNTYTGITTVNNGELAITQAVGDTSLGTPPATFIYNQITLNNNINNGANNYALRNQGANPSTNALSPNRGIFLGANGGGVESQAGATFIIPGAISGTGPFYSSPNHSAGYGYVHVGGQCTYTGQTIIAAGWLFLDANNALPVGTPLTIGSSSQQTNYGSFFNMNGYSQTIGPLSSSLGIGGNGIGFPAIEFGAGSVLTIYQTNVNTTFTGIIGYQVSPENGSLVITVPSGGTGSTLTLNAYNTYTGTTTITMAPGAISGPTLALANDNSPPSWASAPGAPLTSAGTFGSISNTANIIIGAGGTFDVSLLPSTTFNLSSATSLSASGTGTAQGTTAATINGASGGTVNLGSQEISLTFTPTAFSGDTAHPALYVSQGALALNENAISVNNAGASPLGAGTYTLIHVAGGTITGAPNSFVSNITGSGLAAGCQAYTQVSGGNVNLVVVTGTQQQTDLWNGGDHGNSSNWSDAGNWQGDVAPNAPPAAGDNVYFAGSTGPVPVMNNPYNVNSLTFNSGAGSFTLTNSGGNVLNLDSGITNNSASAQTLATPVQLLNTQSEGPSQWNMVNSAGSLTVSGIISDIGNGLTLSGAGKLILSGLNTYTGPTTISGGTLQVDSVETAGTSGPLGESASANHGSILMNGGTLQFSSVNKNDYSGRFSTATNEAASIDVNGQSVVFSTALGGASLTLNDSTGGGTLQIAAKATYTGATMIEGGTLQFNVAGGPLPNATTLIFGSSSGGVGTLDLDGRNQTVAGLAVAGGATASSQLIHNSATGNPTLTVAGGTSTFGGNIQTGPGSGTIALVVSTGSLTLSGLNTYTGATTIDANAVFTIGGAGDLGNSGGSGSYSANITDSGSFMYNSSATQTLSGVISGAGTLTDSGSGKLTLAKIDTYTGATTIDNGSTLALSSAAGIPDSASIKIAGGGTFDVSAITSFAFSTTNTLSASGAGASVGTTAATINGASGGTVNLESQPISLTFTPTSPNGDTTHPALYIAQGALSLSGNTITVSNASGAALRTGTNTLIQVAGGTINGTPNSAVTVTGSGIGAGGTASISVSGGNVDLVVVVPVPVINSFTHSGGNLIISGTNGPDNGTYYVLATTNVALPLSGWTPIATNTFSATGTFSVTNAISGSRQFYAIEVP